MGVSGNRQKTFIEYLLYVSTMYIFSHLVLTVPLRSWLNHPLFIDKDTEAQRGYLRDQTKETKAQTAVCYFLKPVPCPRAVGRALGALDSPMRKTRQGEVEWFVDPSHWWAMCMKNQGAVQIGCPVLQRSQVVMEMAWRDWSHQGNIHRAWSPGLKPGCLCFESWLYCFLSACSWCPSYLTHAITVMKEWPQDGLMVSGSEYASHGH